MNSEIVGEQCTFDLTKSGLRLHPIAFISRRTSDPEKSYHSYVGEACAGIWAIEKFRPFLFGREFTWLTDCSGLRKFFEGDDVPTHMTQRWRMQLLRYDFTIVHRPGRMMFECDLLSRYNQETQKWRLAQEGLTSPSLETKGLPVNPDIPFSNVPIHFTRGTKTWKQATGSGLMGPNINPEQEREAEILMSCDSSKAVWIVGARMNVVREALTDLGVDVRNETPIDDCPVWRKRMNGMTWETAREEAESTAESPSWLIVTSSRFEETHLNAIRELIETLSWKGLEAAIVVHEVSGCPNSKLVHASWNRWARDTLNDVDWAITTLWCENAKVGGSIDAEFKAFLLAPSTVIEHIRTDRTRMLEHDPKQIESP
ncbi:MAG TPA: ribonuclease H family protein, partial [Methylomicrobium sp.]|nr:ribonuclease H family protein [Methylomicrobium sp.]